MKTFTLFLLLVYLSLAPAPVRSAPRLEGFLKVQAVTLASGGTGLKATWTNPTNYTDGSALPVTDITQTRIEYGTCAGSGNSLTLVTVLGQFLGSGGSTTATSAALAPGTYCLRAFTTAKGVESGPTNIVQGSVPQPAPNPPSNLQSAPVVIATTAYMELRVPNGFSFLAVGTVPLGTPCDPNQRVNFFNVVDRALVHFTGTIQPQAVVAACSS